MGKPYAHLHILRVKMGTGVYYTLIFLLPEQQSIWANSRQQNSETQKWVPRLKPPPSNSEIKKPQGNARPNHF